MAKGLLDDELEWLKELRREIGKHRRSNQRKTNLLESKRRLSLIGFSVPPHMVDFQTPLGWAEKAVTVPAARIYREGFRCSVESSLLDDIGLVFGDQQAIFSETASVESSLHHGVAFLFLSKGDEFLGEAPVVVAARSALQASAIVDKRSGVVRAALEVVSSSLQVLHVPGCEIALSRGKSGWEVLDRQFTRVNSVMCEPVVWRRSLSRPFGSSRITRPLIGAIERGVRTLLRMEVTAEFFSAPQRALLGASEEHFTDESGKPIDIWKAITGGVWALPDTYDEDEDKTVRAQLQQLSQASMQPHSEMFNGIVLSAASELSMPISYLGVQHNQPQNEGAIKAEEASMLAEIEQQIRSSYKPTFARVARKAAALMHGEWSEAMQSDLRDLSARFADPGTPTISARSDAALKYINAFPNGDPVVAMEMYGMDDDQIRRNLAYMRRNSAGSLIDRLVSGDSVPGSAVSGASDTSSVELEKAQADVAKKQFEAIGMGVRSGVDPEAVAAEVGLEGIKFTGATPASLRLPEGEAKGLEAAR